MNSKFKGNAALFAVGFLFSASTPLARLLGVFLTPFGVIGSRYLFALPLSLLSIIAKKEKLSFGTAAQRPLLLYSLLFPLSGIFFVLAVFYTKISLAIFAFYIANLLSSLVVGKLLHREQFDVAKKVAFVLSILAVFIFTRPFDGFAFDFGMILGYVSGILQTAASHYQKKHSAIFSDSAFALVHIVGGIVLGFGIAFSIGDFGIFSLPAYALALAVLYGFSLFLISYLFVYGYERADIGTGTLLTSSELVFGPIIAYLVFAETLGFPELFGGALAIAATILVARK